MSMSGSKPSKYFGSCPEKQFYAHRARGITDWRLSCGVEKFQICTKRNKFMLITKFNLLNQRGTEKLIIKTSTHHSQCLTYQRSSGQLEPLVKPTKFKSILRSEYFFNQHSAESKSAFHCPIYSFRVIVLLLRVPYVLYLLSQVYLVHQQRYNL